MAESAAGRTRLDVYLKRTIGKGSYGQVKYCVATVNRRPVVFAVKIVDKKCRTYRNNPSAIDREIAILRQVSHPNLVLLIKTAADSRHVYMYMEYCKYTRRPGKGAFKGRRGDWTDRKKTRPMCLGRGYWGSILISISRTNDIRRNLE